MRRESDNGFVCGTCGETVHMDECACTQPGIEELPESDWQALLGACFQQLLADGARRLRATNDSRALAASNANSRMLLDALRSHL